MSFVTVGGGSAKWSGINIDTDKNMGGYGLQNLKEIALGMIGGDIIARGLSGVLVRIPAGIANTVLTSAGVGLVPTWAPGGLYLNRYVPVNLSTINTVAQVAIDLSDDEPAPLTSPFVVNYLDDTDLVNLLPTLASVFSEDIATIDLADDESCPFATAFDLTKEVDGGVADDGGVQTDESAAAQNDTANDMTLLPAVPAQDDAYYFGFIVLWNMLTLNIAIQGSGTWTVVWEYYNTDTTWHSLADVADGTSGFKAGTGNKVVTFTRPAGWALTDINGVGSMYWIRARVSAYTSIVTQPKGTQAWCTQT
jgi:hypothetical protein